LYLAWRTIAPPGQEGWLRHQEKSREATSTAQTGWWFKFMKKIHNLPDKKTLRQKLRHSATPAEKVLWRSLKNSGTGAKFRRQHGVGPYVLDFYCPEHKLAIEIQGGIHDDVVRSEYDADRQAWLESQGIRVLCFENRELLAFTEHVVEVIRAATLDPPPRLRHQEVASRLPDGAATPPGQEG